MLHRGTVEMFLMQTSVGWIIGSAHPLSIDGQWLHIFSETPNSTQFFKSVLRLTQNALERAPEIYCDHIATAWV